MPAEWITSLKILENSKERVHGELIHTSDGFSERFLKTFFDQYKKLLF